MGGGAASVTRGAEFIEDLTNGRRWGSARGPSTLNNYFLSGGRFPCALSVFHLPINRTVKADCPALSLKPRHRPAARLIFRLDNQFPGSLAWIGGRTEARGNLEPRSVGSLKASRETMHPRDIWSSPIVNIIEGARSWNFYTFNLALGLAGKRDLQRKGREIVMYRWKSKLGTCFKFGEIQSIFASFSNSTYRTIIKYKTCLFAGCAMQ